ncbi:hypothetical protein H9Q70_011199 [Fusarium xylarioides]|nr:hypothetical protein H9Q70_011199 [Fusarium xylarioides]
MDIPFKDVVFDTSDAHRSALSLLPLLFPDRKIDEIRISALTQGTTNGLFKVTVNASTADAVLIKVYGDGTDITIDREKELRLHKLLAERQLSSSPLVRFSNGHAYQFISGRVCSEGDMSETRIFRGVARELARWHATLPTADPKEVLTYKPGVWSTAKKWLDAISKHPHRSQAEIDDLHEKFKYLADALLSTDVSEPLVLAHGDLLCANIIVQESGDGSDVASVRFIDYEHATYCPRAFELANHFAEWTGFDCDYDLLPKTSTRRAFIAEYLTTHAELCREHNIPTVNDASVDHLMRQVDDHRGFPGFYWGLCALIQAETATRTIDFDYAGVFLFVHILLFLDYGYRAFIMAVAGRFLSSIGADVLWRSSRDLKILILLRFIRLLGYGGTTLVLALYLNALGFQDTQIGLFMTLTLVGDLAISFILTWVGDRVGVRVTAVVGALLMSAGGVAFAYFENFWLLLLASIVAVINPSANEIDPFKAIEESAIARLSTAHTCNDMFAWWSMLGMFGTAASNLLTGWLINALEDNGMKKLDCHRIIFLSYAGIGLLKLLCSLLLSSEVEQMPLQKESCSTPQYGILTPAEDETAPLLDDNNSGYGEVTDTQAQVLVAAQEKRLFTPASFAFMWKLSLALILDFVGSGLAQISWMTYFFKREYDMPEGALGSATFTAGIISSVLNLASSPLSRAIGQVQTMVLCHTVNSISLLMVSVPGNKYIALVIFIFRIVTREIDNAPRQAFISAGVLDHERTSAMGVVNITKTIGSCLGLYITGLFAGLDKFWLAFILAGALKLSYNVLILAFFWKRR